MSLQIRQLSHTLGAEITGVDIGKPLDDRSFGEINAAYLKYNMLLFRGRPLTREQHIEFCRRFGELDTNAHSAPRDRTPGYPEIQLKTKAVMSPGVKARHWHSDRAYWCTPVSATVLRGVEIPGVGGDTMFANMYVAYETLSDGMKKLIDGLFIIHPGTGRIIDDSTPERVAESKKLNPPIAHPLVRVHPETGRKALFVSEKTKQLVGMTVEESKPLIDVLCNHATRSEYIYRHQWRKDDLLMWDNRCTLHRVVGDYDKNQRRHIEKVCVMGTPSGGYVYDGALQGA